MKLQYNSKKLVKVSDIEIPTRFFQRMKTGVEELDNVFGNGILPGLTFTLTARPGTGKTTFLLQLLDNLAKQGYRTGYFTGEEDTRQVAYTCKRLSVTEVAICNETDIDKICEMAQELDILVIDSFPCLTIKGNLNARAREKAIVEKVINTAENTNCAMGIILHITKSGDYKGSTLIPHAVGANFSLSVNPLDEYERVVSSSKNRYGSTCNLIVSFGENGFNFTNCRNVDTIEKAPSKADENKKLMDKITSMTEPPGITMNRVMCDLNINRTKAYTLLKELTDQGVLKKFGRGDSACWKQTKVVTVAN